MSTNPRWLDETEMAAWRAYIETVDELSASLETDLAAHGLTMGDYQVLVYLSETEGRQLRMCDLASRLRLSPSGLTRRLDGLVQAGLVRRVPSTTDRRVHLAELTDEGFERLRAAAPDHVEGVRRELFDHLDARQVAMMADIFQTLQRARHAGCADAAIADAG